mgnify:CR=1 FL=1
MGTVMNKTHQNRLPQDFKQLTRSERAQDAQARIAQDGLIGDTSKEKYPRQHDNATKRKEQARITRGRMGKAALLLTASAASLVGAAKIGAGDENPFIVDRDAITQMDDVERSEQFDKIVVHPGDTLSKLAEDYAEQHDADAYEVRESLTVQARQIDVEAGNPMNAHVVQPGEVYYLPRD